MTVGHAEVVLKHYMQSKHHSDWEVVKLRRSDLNSEALVETDAEEDEEGYLMLAEASFVVDIPEVGKLNLRPDLLLRSASGLRVVDHKTTSSYLGSRMYNEARFGHQLRLYAMGMGTLLGKPVLEAMINGVHAGKKASSDSFKGTRFDFYTFDYTPDDFEETIAWYRAGVEEMKRIEELSPQNPGSHCGYCDYGELCTKPPAFRPTLMKLKYGSK